MARNQRRRRFYVKHSLPLPGGRKLEWNIYTLALLALLVYSGVKLIGHNAQSRHTKQVNEQVQALYAQAASEAPASPAPADTPAPTDPPQSTAPAGTPAPTQRPAYQLTGAAQDVRAELQGLYNSNSDLAGWLKISDVVNLPVMYNADNSFYETHDFYKNESASGTLFLDALHPLAANTQHLVIHGHNMRDGSMFGHLTRYQQREYARQHSTISWTTLYREESYDVFAVAVVSTDYENERYLDYLSKIRFASQEELDEYMAQLRAVASYWTGTEIGLDDALLTLSTCLGDDRILVVGKRNDGAV